MHSRCFDCHYQVSYVCYNHIAHLCVAGVNKITKVTPNSNDSSVEWNCMDNSMLNVIVYPRSFWKWFSNFYCYGWYTISGRVPHYGSQDYGLIVHETVEITISIVYSTWYRSSCRAFEIRIIIWVEGLLVVSTATLGCYMKVQIGTAD